MHSRIRRLRVFNSFNLLLLPQNCKFDVDSWMIAMYRVCNKYGIIPIRLFLDRVKNYAHVRKENYRFRERNKESDGIINVI